MESKKETVTLNLNTYKEMEKELQVLREQVKQKTIYKEVLPPVYKKRTRNLTTFRCESMSRICCNVCIIWSICLFNLVLTQSHT